MFEVNKIGDPVGAEIVGLDTSGEIDDDTMRNIEAAFADHAVIVFRDQNLTPEQQLAFAGRFGVLEINTFDRHALDGHDGILVVSNIVEDGKSVGYADAGSFWHSDMSYTATPPRLTMLYAIEIPHRDGRSIGNTLFASAVDAYDALTDETRERIADRRAIHSIAAKKRGIKKAIKLDPAQIEKNPDVLHPIARTHPITGRKSIFVTADECTGIEGLEDSEARPLIDELAAHVIKPEFQYRHSWRVGDLLVWDNAAVQQVVDRDYEWPRDRRLLHRITVNGSASF